MRSAGECHQGQQQKQQQNEADALSGHVVSRILRHSYNDVQLAWGYVLRQLQHVGAQNVQWYLHDTSHSGITGHSGKVDYCVTADKLKAWPQVVALAEVKEELTFSLYTECIGQLSARTLDIFDQQPHRRHAVVIAGAQEFMEVLVFDKDCRIMRSGLQSFSLSAESSGLRWLAKALFSSLPSMVFIPELLPLDGFTPLGTPIRKGLCCRAAAPTRV